MFCTEGRNVQDQIKIEVSPVLRGTVHPPTTQDVVPRVEDEFGFASMAVVSLPDLYGGKICAALDRQHPPETRRDVDASRGRAGA
ncbi:MULTISPECIES: nucleotidyl transferase AbiEii/AbiGii toxin family protein [unclassified Pseudomonas]|uniref:nucleotidyl transferase AbiEii/AbiGii toxin family protein n=1 Tax=unclassified Pseudomonas TaxID=196821 RepID=UPI002113FDC1|nr:MULTISPECIES: nucleotidyl transferase AbiEii/AbiGii toxin family protein [unclassified Pseudomonas]